MKIWCIKVLELELSRSHELFNEIVRDQFSLFLVLEDERGKDVDQLLLEEATEELSARVVSSNLFKLFVVLQEKSKKIC